MCGWNREGDRQDNWLFTQHISQGDFDPNTFSYPVEIHVDINFGVANCKGLDEFGGGCNRRFDLYKYETNTSQPSSTEGEGFMNRQNYESFAVENTPGRGPRTTIKNSTFTLPPSSTGFYIAVQDTGSCIALARLRVYRNKCNSRRVGLVEYGDAPPPASSDLKSPVVPVSCVPNSFIRNDSGLTNRVSGSVTCFSNGTWGPEIPRCECNCGYEESPSTDPSGFTCTSKYVVTALFIMSNFLRWLVA